MKKSKPSIHDRAGALIFDKAQKHVLVVKERAFPKELRKWGIPKGKRKGNESVDECMKREVLEEVGLDLDVLAHKSLYTRIRANVKVLVLEEEKENVSVKIDRVEIKKYKWLSIEESVKFIENNRAKCNFFLRVCYPTLQSLTGKHIIKPKLVDILVGTEILCIA